MARTLRATWIHRSPDRFWLSGIRGSSLYWPPFCTYPRTNSSALASNTSSISSSRSSTSSVNFPTRSWTSPVSSTATSSTSSVLRAAFSCPPPVSFVGMTSPSSSRRSPYLRGTTSLITFRPQRRFPFRAWQADAMGVEEVADELYALPPEDFTAARAAAAKADKAAAKEIAALRKPTVGAWLVNTLARHEPDLLDELLALGPALAKAQSSGKGAQLRELGDQRRQLVSAVTDKAFEAAEREPTAALRSEVESTLEAALADRATADAVRTGRLTRALSYAGFGGVDLEGAVAVGPAKGASRKTPAKSAAKTTAKPTARPDRSKDVAAAEIRAQDAAGDLDDAVRACQSAQQAQEEAERAEQQAGDEVTRSEAALREARAART